MRLRVVLGIVVLCGSGLYATLRSTADLLAVYQSGHGPRTIGHLPVYEARFFGLRASQPSHLVVEYIDDQEDPYLSRTAWVLTQYALVPWIVLPKNERTRIPGQLVVGNFHRGGHGPEKFQGLGFVGDYGRGIMLFVRTGP